MSPHKLRKTRKLRGSRTVGWGQVAQHRKHSQKGGRRVGSHKHLWTYIVKYEPNYFGNKGFMPRSSREEISVINVGELDELTAKLAMEKQLEKKEGKAFIDLGKLGYDKLLATGKMSRPVLVKVAMHSEGAAKKIEAAGGKIFGEAEEAPEPTEEMPAED